MAKGSSVRYRLKIDQQERKDGKIQLTVTIPPETLDTVMKSAAYVLALHNKVDLAGFKMDELIPYVVDKVGEAQYLAFANQYVMSAAAPHAISQKNIEPIMEPELKSLGELIPGTDFSFVAVVSPKPYFELSSYEPVTVKIPKITVTEKEIDEQILFLAQRHAKIVVEEGSERLEEENRVVPAITDAWVKDNMPELENVDGLREMLREQGIEFKTKEQEGMELFATASALAERFEGVIADEIYEFMRSDMLANIAEELRQNGTTLEQYVKNMGVEMQQFQMMLMMQVRETLRQSFALDALARHLKITITDEDISEALTRMTPGNEERALLEFEESGRMYMLREFATRTKANQWLVQTATFEVLE